jgi:hypothetical protein
VRFEFALWTWLNGCGQNRKSKELFAGWTTRDKEGTCHIQLLISLGQVFALLIQPRLQTETVSYHAHSAPDGRLHV